MSGGNDEKVLLGKRGFIRTVRPELVEGFFVTLITMGLFHSWFDKLTTNGINLRFP